MWAVSGGVNVVHGAIEPSTALFISAPLAAGANTMSPAAFQVAPRGDAASARVDTVPAVRSRTRSCPPAKNPIRDPSADQNGATL